MSPNPGGCLFAFDFRVAPNSSVSCKLLYIKLSLCSLIPIPLSFIFTFIYELSNYLRLRPILPPSYVNLIALLNKLTNIYNILYLSLEIIIVIKHY